jgi:hypothetical protein
VAETGALVFVIMTLLLRAHEPQPLGDLDNAVSAL